MKKAAAMILCILLWTAFSVTVVSGEEPPAVQVQLLTSVEIFGQMTDAFQTMKGEDLARAYELMEQVRSLYKDDKFAEYRGRFEFIDTFRAAWTALRPGNYVQAYDKFMSLKNHPWTGTGAETVMAQVDALRKYAKAMTEAETSKPTALATLESIEIDKVTLPDILIMVSAKKTECADAIYEDAKDKESKGLNKDALELYKALEKGEYKADISTRIIRLEKIVSYTPPETPESVISDLVLEEATPVSLKLAWKDTVASNTYVVTYAPQGVTTRVSITVEKGTSVRLEKLIPSTTYDVSLSARTRPSEALTASYATRAAVGEFRDYSVKYKTIALYSYDMKNALTYGLETIIRTDQVTRLSTNSITLPSFEMESGSTGYFCLVSFNCEQTETDKVLSLRGVLRVSGGGTYQENCTATVKGNRTSVQLWFPLNAMLDECYLDTGNKWPETSAVIDVYIREQYFGRYSFILEP